VQSQVRLDRVPEKVPEKSGRLWCKARSSSTGFRRRSWRLWCSQVKFNRVPEKVPEKAWEALVQPGQVQQGSGEGSSAARFR